MALPVYIRRVRINKILSNKKIVTIFTLPAFLLYGVFVLIPTIYSICLSMFQTDLIGKRSFVLLRNYMNLLNDKIFLRVLKNSGVLAVGPFLVHLPLALLSGNSIFIRIGGSQLFQSILFLPSVIYEAGVELLFNMIYNPEFGLPNTFLDLIHLSGFKHAWLSEEKMVILVLIIVMMWKYMGYHVVIQLVAMKSIPDSLSEAARIDGTTTWQQFTKIIYPLIKYAIKIDVVPIIAGSLKYFDSVRTMTEGGPNHASEVTATYIYYQGSRTMRFGYTSAIGLVLLALCVLVIWGANRLIWTEKSEYQRGGRL